MVECRWILRCLRTPAVRLTILLLIAVPLYLFAVVRHWLQRVPVIPTASLQLGPHQMPLGYASTGEFRIAQVEQYPPRPYSSRLTGPIEYWHLDTGTKVRDALTLEHFVRPESPEFVTRRDEALILDDATGRITGPFPAADRWSPTFHAIGPTRAIVATGDALSCYDTVLRRVVWTLPNVQSIERVVPGHAEVLFSDPTPAGASGQLLRKLVDLEHGQVNPWIHPGKRYELVDLSRDGRFAIILIDQRREVWSLTDGRLLWSLDKLPLPLSGLRFSDDGDELVGHGLDATGRLWTTRLRSSDGRPVVSPSGADVPEQMSLIPPVATAGQKFALVPDTLAIARWSPLPLVWMSRVHSSLRLMVEPMRSSHFLSLYDLETRQRLAVVDKDDARLHISPDHSGFVLVRPPASRSRARLDYYAYPPQRNWPWLWRWTLGPLVVVATGLIVMLRRRRNHAV